MRVLLDACVLYPTVMRELLLGCAGKGLFEPRWSARISEEWARAAARLGPEGEAIARGEIAMLDAKFPRGRTKPAPDLERRLWLPDPDDVHVLASAVAGHCDVIVTMNAKDFPRDILAEEGLSRADPDNFLLGLFEASPGPVGEVVDAVVAEASRLSGEGWEPRRLLKKARLNRFGKAVELRR
ncbi:RSP_2648 family PIN domain-containing protein [Limimaricola pyoseonensis]|uniref:PIN domain-containing protein n=1 Tax=Limimaricola pyoseonensis TaxID=521013 RepID=A0A1G7ATP4_9RHOB|nr:PIN domain-containing protein [Limimaricola pyoseonensis]SDE18082.1 PIN domain-containing protein [Limimaricola pyoseonensis]